MFSGCPSHFLWLLSSWCSYHCHTFRQPFVVSASIHALHPQIITPVATLFLNAYATVLLTAWVSREVLISWCDKCEIWYELVVVYCRQGLSHAQSESFLRYNMSDCRFKVAFDILGELHFNTLKYVAFAEYQLVEGSACEMEELSIHGGYHARG